MEQERWEIRATSCAALKTAERAREGNILGKYTQRGRDPVLQGTAAKFRNEVLAGPKGVWSHKLNLVWRDHLVIYCWLGPRACPNRC